MEGTFRLNFNGSGVGNLGPAEIYGLIQKDLGSIESSSILIGKLFKEVKQKLSSINWENHCSLLALLIPATISGKDGNLEEKQYTCDLLMISSSYEKVRREAYTMTIKSSESAKWVKK